MFFVPCNKLYSEKPCFRLTDINLKVINKDIKVSFNFAAEDVEISYRFINHKSADAETSFKAFKHSFKKSFFNTNRTII